MNEGEAVEQSVDADEVEPVWEWPSDWKQTLEDLLPERESAERRYVEHARLKAALRG